MKTRPTAVGILALMAIAQPSGVAHADETHTDSHNGHNVSLVSTGQIDDPLEDVLEHATLFGQTSMEN